MNKRFVFLVVMGFLQIACSSVQNPENVSDEFWRAVKVGDENAIAQYVTDESRTDVNLSDERLRNINFKFGEIRIRKENAEIETIVELDERGNRAEKHFDTVLKKENGRWKVVFSETMSTLTAQDPFAGLVEQLKRMGDDFSGSINDLLNQMEEDLPELENKIKENSEHVLNELAKALSEKSPEVRQRMEDIVKELEKALKDSIEKLPQEVPAPNKPITI